MRSAKRATARAALVAACLALSAVAAAGCSTTQETAARKQAEAKRFLKLREARRAEKKAHEKEKR